MPLSQRWEPEAMHDIKRRCAVAVGPGSELDHRIATIGEQFPSPTFANSSEYRLQMKFQIAFAFCLA